MPWREVRLERGPSHLVGAEGLTAFRALYAAILEGAASPVHGPHSWETDEQVEHVRHASDHLRDWLDAWDQGEEGACGEDHLGHALCRIMMAIERGEQ